MSDGPYICLYLIPFPQVASDQSMDILEPKDLQNKKVKH